MPDIARRHQLPPTGRATAIPVHPRVAFPAATGPTGLGPSVACPASTQCARGVPARNPVQPADPAGSRRAQRANVDELSIPEFDLPWPEAIHPDVELVERLALQWAEHHRLMPDDQYRARVRRAKYGWLAARCYPHADRELLQLMADYVVWFFIADDAFVDRVQTVTSQTIPNLTAMIDVLDLGRLGDRPVFGESAWLDVCQRLRLRLSDEHFQRFAYGMRMWASTAGLQILNHTRPESVGVRQYETIRRHTSGTFPCLDVLDVANAGALAPEEAHHPHVRRLCLHANNIICWSNDVQSLRVEVRQPGQYWNMAVIYAMEGHSLQDGVDYTADRVHAELASFQALAAHVEPLASRELRGFISGLRDWMRGYQDWVKTDTGRYRQEHAQLDADDTAYFG